MDETVPLYMKYFVQIKMFSIEGNVKITKHYSTNPVLSAFFGKIKLLVWCQFSYKSIFMPIITSSISQIEWDKPTKYKNIPNDI